MRYLSNKTFGCVKGWCALCILLHHIYQFSGILSGTAVSFVFINLGYWAVGLFIFMSGFGLYESYRSKGHRYLDSFWRNRLLPFVLTYLFVATVYILFDFVAGNPHTPEEYICTFTYGNTIISFGWYLQLNMVMYLIFWFTFRFGHEKRSRFGIFCVLSVLFLWINQILEITFTRSIPVLFFAVGILWAVYKEPIEKLLGRIGLFVLPAAFAVSFAGYLVMWRHELPGLALVGVYTASETALIILVMVLIRELDLWGEIWGKKTGRCLQELICNRISTFLGVNSLEIYVCQGLVLRSLYTIIDNKYVFAIISIVCVFIIAVPLHKLISTMGGRIRKEL